MYHRFARRLASQILVFALLQPAILGLNITASTHGIQKRGSPFLPLTFMKDGAVLNFVCGFGVPVEDLEFESITSGIVFKSQHFLPGSLAALRKHSVTNVDGRADDRQLGNYRWMIYKFVGSILDNLGYNGKSCVLRSICEAASLKLHNGNGLLGELLHIILSPSTSKDLPNLEQTDYIKAEQLGRQSDNCFEAYSECKKSFLSDFTHIF